MKRDTTGLRDELDGHDVDPSSALWIAATANFPRLPADAPGELRRLTIEVDDPKRVYTIHRASRRHHFHILVERYIHQLRYGCQNAACTTTTCFSCRKRIAAGAPIRRYNATSARTLAVHLASQDNPEQGLCHHPSAERPVLQIKKAPDLLSGRTSVSITKSGNGSAEALGGQLDGVANQLPANSVSHTKRNVKAKRRDKPRSKANRPGLNVVDEPTTVDHKSFVQNVFGTVAFKMIEWLTPRNLETLAAAEDETAEGCRPDSAKENENVWSHDSSYVEEETRGEPVVEDPADSDIGSSRASDTPGTSSQIDQSAELEESGDQEAKVNLPLTTDISNPAVTHTPSPALRRKSDHTQSPLPKLVSNLSTSPKSPGPTTDTKATSKDFLGALPQRRTSQQDLNPSPKIRHTKIAPTSPDKLSVSQNNGAASIIPMGAIASSTNQRRVQTETTLSSSIPARAEISKDDNKTSKKEEIRDHILPQSLSCLNIEVINFMCDVLQQNHTLEKHSLYPETVEFMHHKHRNTKLVYNSGSISGITSTEEASEWRTFIEQSFYDVLSRPDSLLLSFGDAERPLFDTQTIWYLMLRLTRVTPSLVLDSLWIAAGALFHPPDKVESLYEWPQNQSSQSKSLTRNLSNFDAARLINICLHALVATAPLVSTASQLANMSRIRSYGWTMLGRNMTALESATVCLQYDDVFSNELALRLARRLFAAIPTRRRFTELLELQQEVRSEEAREQDILEAVLSMIKFLDTPPILNFQKHERDLHEKRAPTLILDWARTVMLRDWEGAAEVPGDGPFGGALAMMAAIYKNRKSLLLGDIHFHTEYFAERLDPVEMPIEWANFESNKRTVHLLDFPYLFSSSTLITYFRAINYSRMNQAYETAKAKFGLMRVTAAESTLLTDHERRHRLYERLSTATSRYLVLDISRQRVLQDTFDAVWRREERELLRPLKIRLGEEAGEEGLDSGGVQQEFLRLAIAEALNPDYGAFTIDTRNQMTWFQPGSPEPLWKFELIGMIISLAVYNGLTLPVTFPKALYRKLLDKEISELHHISDGWPELTNGLTALLEWDESEGLVEDIFGRTYEFSVEQFGQPVSREMGTSTRWPQFNDVQTTSNPIDAPLVTNENRNAYVSDYIRWLTDISIRPQFEAFKSGFFACIDRRSITLFDADTLQALIEGIQEIDINELRRATRYEGWDASHRVVRDFWSVVKRYDQDQKKKLLEFVTASDRVPVGGMRNVQFSVQKNGVEDTQLPRSYTCYGVLLLPEYSSKEILKQKLAMALENAKGFGFA